VSPIYVPGKVVLRKSWQPMDPDAAAYITAVEAADTAAGSSGGLEEKTKIAIDNFVLGCKADGIWGAIKASCILAGARTLAGALVPLAGTAPTNVNFVSGDYNRKTGLKGDGSTKYLNSNRANNADPQNNNHCGLYLSEIQAINVVLGAGGSSTGANTIVPNVSDTIFRNRSSSFLQINRIAVAGLTGASRSNASEIVARIASTSTLHSLASQSPSTDNIYLLARNDGSGVAQFHSASRFAFYSIGEYIDLTRLDSRVTDLINAIGAAF
jgi:hypothetical protein